MTFKPQFRLIEFNNDKINQLNRVIAKAYSTRLESVFHNNGTTVQSLTYQSEETGRIRFSATGSAVVSKIIALNEKQNTVVYGGANTDNVFITATLTDITSSHIIITCANQAGTAFSSITDSVNVYYHVRGSNP